MGFFSFRYVLKRLLWNWMFCLKCEQFWQSWSKILWETSSSKVCNMFQKVTVRENRGKYFQIYIIICVMRMFIRKIMVGIISTSCLAVPLLCWQTRGCKVTTFLFLSNLYNKGRMYFTFWFLLHNIVVSTCTLHSKLTLPPIGGHW